MGFLYAEMELLFKRFAFVRPDEDQVVLILGRGDGYQVASWKNGMFRRFDGGEYPLEMVELWLKLPDSDLLNLLSAAVVDEVLLKLPTMNVSPVCYSNAGKIKLIIRENAKYKCV